VGLLLAASFVLVQQDADATVESGADERGIYIYSETLDSTYIYPGDRGISFYIRIRNGDNDLFSDDDPIRNCNVSIDETVHDEEGRPVNSPVDNWVTREVNADATLYDGASAYTFSTFEFNVRPNAQTMVYNLTVRMSYRTSGGERGNFMGHIHFDVRPRAVVNDVTGLYPGDVRKGITVTVDVLSTLTDTTLELTAPTGFSWFGSTTQTISAFRSGSTSYDWYVPFTISVNEGLPPRSDGYPGSYRLEYQNFYGLNIIETGEMAFHVEPLPMLTASLEMGDFVQGTTATTLTAKVRNTGNVDLLDVKVWIDQVSTAFIYTAADHYEGSYTVSYSEVEVGDIRMTEMADVELSVVVDTFIPEGEHRILMDFSGYFLDPLTDTYSNVYTFWTSGNQGYYPVVRVDSSYIYLSPEDTTLEGTYASLHVVDDAVEVRVQSSTVLNLGGQLTDNRMYIYVENFGNVDYDNVVMRLETNTAGSPFLNPVDPDSPVSEDIIMADSLTAGRTYSNYAHLSIKPGTEPGVYLVPVYVEGINSDTGGVFSAELEARITLRGVGPRLKIMDVSPSEVRPGEDFTLELKLTNVGDDTAWGVCLAVPPKVTEKEGVTSGVEDAVTTPEPEVLPIYLGTIRPGDVTTVEIPMRCSDKVEGGQIYPFYFCINCTDSYGFNPRDDALHYEVAIKTRSTVTDSPWMSVIIIVIIGVLVILALIVVRRRGAGPMVATGPAPGGPATAPPTESVPPGTGPAPPPEEPVIAETPGEAPPPAATPAAPPPQAMTMPPSRTKPPAKRKMPPSDLVKASGVPMIAPGFLDGSFADGKVALNWKRPIGEDPKDIKGYRILRWDDNTDLAVVGEVTKGLDYVDKDVTPGVTYNYAVQAFNDRGQSDVGNWIEIPTA
jgi:hypothetical protein